MDEQRRIVVGVDDSTGARHALRWAIEHASALDASVDALLAYEFRPAWIDYDLGVSTIEHWQQRAETAAKEELHRVVAEARRGENVTVREIVVASDPATALVQHSKDADLLVVGSRGRDTFRGLLLGSVSRRCTEHALCPVVVVPSVVPRP